MQKQLSSLRVRRATLLAFAALLLVSLLSSLFITNSSTVSAAGRADEKKNYLLIYSDKGKYSKALVYSTSGDKKCGGKTVTGEKALSVGLSKAKTRAGAFVAARIACDPGTYNVYFLKKGEKVAEAKTGATRRYAAVALPEGHCSFVHKKGVTRNEAVVNNRCAGDDNPNEDTVEKFTPVMTATTTPSPITQGKKYTMLVELKNPDGSPMSTEECSSSFTTSRPIAGLARKNNQGEYPVRYNAKTKTCQYKLNVSSAKTKDMSSGIYNLNFKGNAFLNPASTEYRETVVKGAEPAKGTKQSAPDKKRNAGNTATKNAKISSLTLTKASDSSVSMKAVVTGVDDCNRINPNLDQVIKAKGKNKTKAKPTGSTGITKSKEGDNCILTATLTYDKPVKKSDISVKLSFKTGTKQTKKTSNKVTLGN